FFVSITAASSKLDLALTCTGKGASAKPVLYPIQVSAVAATEEAWSPTAWLNDLPFEGALVTRLVEDPETISPKRLAELSLPPKPDRSKNADAYAAWLTEVTTPVVQIEPSTFETGVVNDLFWESSGNWAGFETGPYTSITAPRRHNIVSGQWTIPAVTGPTNTTGTFYSSAWVGLGGYESTYNVGMPQTGTEQKATCIRNAFSGVVSCVGTYYAWQEYYPDGEIQITNFPVTKGNVIAARVMMVNGIGQGDAWGTSALLQLTNLSKSPPVATWTTYSLPSGVTFNADSSEWIMERPLVNGVTTSLAKFSDFVMSNTQMTIADASGTQHTVMYGDSAALSSQIDMWNGSHQLATSAPGSGSLPAGEPLTIHWTGAN
ncbi:MAG TPA: G1 family glutamic endopeptidase, partial [Polyangiaceae bacterium]|nr:G1 family glutamic endopeptidase [Polyangiaceae bacterium]